MNNNILNNAKNAKQDEFYTLFSDIENELTHYVDYFKNAIVYCNCDNPIYSNFWKYFHLNFSALGLKKLISTHYDKSEPTYKMEYEGGDDNNVEAGTITPLEGNGDFRNQECLNLLDESDIVVTNPPFSLFKEYLSILMEHHKKFVIIGNVNAISYKESFHFLKNNEMWLGYGGNCTMTFRMPDYYELKGSAFIGEDGHKYIKMGSCAWYTNLDIKKRHDFLNLTERYNPAKYPTYVNYDAINVDKVRDIPCDYDGVIGVPITFLSVHNPEQFEIIGNSLELCGKMSLFANKGEYMTGGIRPYIELQNGKYKYKRLYDRLFIKKIIT